MKTFNGIEVKGKAAAAAFGEGYLELLKTAVKVMANSERGCVLMSGPEVTDVLRNAGIRVTLEPVWARVAAFSFGPDLITLHTEHSHESVDIDDLAAADLVDLVGILVEILSPSNELIVPRCLSAWFPGSARKVKEADYRRMWDHIGNLPGYLDRARQRELPLFKSESIGIDGVEVKIKDLDDNTLDLMYKCLFDLLYKQAVAQVFWLSRETFAREINIQLPGAA